MILAALAAATLSLAGTPSAVELAPRIQLVEAEPLRSDAAAPSLVELETERRALEADRPTFRPSAALLGTGFGLTAAGVAAAAIIFFTSGGWDALAIAAVVLVAAAGVGALLVVAGFIMLAVSGARLAAHDKKVDEIDRRIEEHKALSAPPPPAVLSPGSVSPSVVLLCF